MSKQKEVKSHAMLVGNFTPYHEGHNANVGQMLAGGHDSVNVFATASPRGTKPIPVEKKVDYIKTAVGHDVNVNSTTNPFHAASQVYSSGKRGNLVVYGGSDRKGIVDRLNDYNGKEGKHGYFKFNSIQFRQVGGERDDNAKGIDAFSGTAARKSKTVAELKKYLPKALHPRAAEIFKDLNESAPIGIFLLGGPGSGKDYVLKNIFSKFDLMEVQIDQVINGAAKSLFEQGTNVVINGGDAEKIQLVKMMIEDYTFDHVFVSVTNKVSRERNSGLRQPLAESKRIDRFLKAEKMVASFEDVFVFNNSINLNESSEMEKIMFAGQIEKLLERVVDLGLEMKELPTKLNEQDKPKKKTFAAVRHDKKSGLPSKYVKGLSRDEIEAKKAHIDRNAKLSDRDPEAYKDMPGDKEAREEGIPQSKYTKKFHDMYGEAANPAQQAAIAINMKKRGIKPKSEQIEEGAADKSLAAKAEKSGVPLSTLKKVYKRGVAAWNSGHRPGTTPAQWGHARVNSYITRGKTYHTADSDLHEELDQTQPLPPVLPKVRRSGGITAVQNAQQRNRKTFKQITSKTRLVKEMQLDGTDEYRQYAIDMTPGQDQEIEDVTANLGQVEINSGCSCGGSCGENCSCSATNESCSCGNGGKAPKDFRRFRKISEAKKEEQQVQQQEVLPSTINPNPKLDTKRKQSRTVRAGTGVGAIFNPNGPLGFPQTTFSQLPLVNEEDSNSVYHEFAKFCCDHHDMKQEQMPTLNLHDDPDWTTQNGTFGHYSPSTNTINLSITGRHPMDIMRTLAHEITHAYQNSQSPLPPEAGETGSDWENHANAEAGVIMRKWRDAKPEAFKAMMESATLSESVEYHLQNNISFTENVFRPGSENFFMMIKEAKRLYAEGKYNPADEYEQDLLESNIGETAIYEGQEVILDFPFEEQLNEDDETGGHGIGKPFRSHGGGAVYVKNSKGNVIKVNFSQSGMRKRINEPKRVRSFIARHHCLTNKDRTSASYWACRWPRYFSDTGQQWW